MQKQTRNSSTTKVSKHTAWSCSIFPERTFHNRKKKKNGHYRGRDFTKKFCYHKLFMKKEMAPLPNGVTKSMNLMLTKKRQRLQK